MTMVAKHAVELGNHIYRKGETCEWDGAIDARIRDNFTKADGTPLGETDAGPAPAEHDREDETKARIAKTIAVMKREGVMQALDGMGVTYPPKAKTEYLAKLLLVTKGEIEV